MPDSLYVNDLRYLQDSDAAEVNVGFSNDPSHQGIMIHYVVALELIQAIADAGGVDMEIMGPRK